MKRVSGDSAPPYTEQLTESEKNARALLPRVYTELRKLAASYMRNERRDHTLQPTDLVHEAYIRILGNKRIDWQGKTHFFAMAATQMRRVLVDHARSRQAKKRNATLLTLSALGANPTEHLIDMLALDEAMNKLSSRSQRQADVFELRLFSGMQHKEIATELSVSERTVRNDWIFARAWISRELNPAEGNESER